jgi:hypothetical protein
MKALSYAPKQITSEIIDASVEAYLANNGIIQKQDAYDDPALVYHFEWWNTTKQDSVALERRLATFEAFEEYLS